MDTLTVRSNSHCVSSQAERDIQMAEKRDAPKDSFFQYYEKYIVEVYCRQRTRRFATAVAERSLLQTETSGTRQHSSC